MRIKNKLEMSKNGEEVKSNDTNYVRMSSEGE
jgi:hypothetical protein